MNVFRFELRRAWVSAAVWTLVILGLLGGLIIGALPAFLGSRAGVEAMLASFPPAFAAAFGLQMDNLFSFGGFYSFGYLYYSLFGAIMAAGIGQFFEWVKLRAAVIRGVTFGTMLQDEALSFIRLGGYIERADNTARILDVKYHVLNGDGEEGASDFYQ